MDGGGVAAAAPDNQEGSHLLAELDDLSADAMPVSAAEGEALQLCRQAGHTPASLETAPRLQLGAGSHVPAVADQPAQTHAPGGSWEIEYQSLQITRTLGTGTFGPESGMAQLVLVWLLAAGAAPLIVPLCTVMQVRLASCMAPRWLSRCCLVYYSTRTMNASWQPCTR